MRFAIVGPGRAGGAFEIALQATGASLAARLGRSDDPSTLDPALDLVLITVPDSAIAEVAAAIPHGPLVVHVSGATSLGPLLAHHERCGSLHPLVSLTDPTAGAKALQSSPHVAIAASRPDVLDEMRSLAGRLGARSFVVDDDRRANYHAAASIAANHLVGLLGQVERVASADGLPLAPFIEMMRAVLDNVDRVGPRAALTGPVARGDWETVRSHLAALPTVEHQLYLSLAAACAALADRSLPTDLRPAPEVPT